MVANTFTQYSPALVVNTFTNDIGVHWPCCLESTLCIHYIILSKNIYVLKYKIYNRDILSIFIKKTYENAVCNREKT